ncbi:uncharacterized protein VTP21DRAFT_449 [Calcarisporiella thermophila]|uniref:uncharacterized protein n=1 Tax=Calcarisporiella thermophila TaxID=911321 RepID=UPI003743DBBE
MNNSLGSLQAQLCKLSQSENTHKSNVQNKERSNLSPVSPGLGRRAMIGLYGGGGPETISLNTFVSPRESSRRQPIIPIGMKIPITADDPSWDPARHSYHHMEMEETQRPLILNSILEHVGNTPMVRVDKIAKSEGLECDLLAKCEFLNAGGSVKDRIAKRMIEEAERSGLLKPGGTIIEPTSGNTGIGLAMAAAVKGYRTIFTLTENISWDKIVVLKALGAEIVRTPTEAARDAPESYISVAKRLNEEIKDSVVFDQYSNPYNPIAHYDTTAEEILRACGGKVDMFVAGAGTGGTLTGVARKLKEKCPNVKIVGVDPHGSILAQPDSLNDSVKSYTVEGIGRDFIPRALDRSLVDKWIKTDDEAAFQMTRRLIREEGLLCGGSSGSVMVAAIEAARELGPGQKCVTLLADGVRNYFSKFMDDEWMKCNRYTDKNVEREETRRVKQYGGAVVKDLKLPDLPSIDEGVPCRDAIDLMRQKGLDRSILVAGPSEELVGFVSLGNVIERISNHYVTSGEEVGKVKYRIDRSQHAMDVTEDTPLSELVPFFEKHPAAVVVAKKGDRRAKYVVTKMDVLLYLKKRDGGERNEV